MKEFKTQYHQFKIGDLVKYNGTQASFGIVLDINVGMYCSTQVFWLANQKISLHGSNNLRWIK